MSATSSASVSVPFSGSERPRPRRSTRMTRAIEPSRSHQRRRPGSSSSTSMCDKKPPRKSRSTGPSPSTRKAMCDSPLCAHRTRPSSMGPAYWRRRYAWAGREQALGHRVDQVRGIAPQQPALLGALQQAVARQIAERGGDRRAPCADQARERAVGQPHRDQDAVGRDAAPALGQRPQRERQPVLEADELVDHQPHRQPALAARGAREERVDDRRVAHGRVEEALVEHGEAQRLQDRPARDERQVGVGAVGVPRAQDVAEAEDLGRGAAAEVEVAQQQAVDEQQAQRGAAGLQRRPPHPSARSARAASRRPADGARDRARRAPTAPPARDRRRAGGRGHGLPRPARYCPITSVDEPRFDVKPSRLLGTYSRFAGRPSRRSTRGA